MKLASILISSTAAAASSVIAAPQSGSGTSASTNPSHRLIVSKNLGPSNSTICIDGGSSSLSSLPQALNCTGVASQLFSLTITPTTTPNVVSLCAIVNNASSLCLDPIGSSSSGTGGSGTAVKQNSCQTTGYSQKWIYHFGTATIRPYYNIQLCLDATGGGGLSGPNLVVDTCFNGTTGVISTQQWVFL